MFWNAKNRQVPLGGTEMSCVSFGRGGKTFVILPGLSDGLTTVAGKALLLAKPYEPFFENYTVWMFSRKNRMPEGYSIRDMARDQAEAMRALGISSAAVMGVSEGGMIAQWLAVDFPEAVEKLVIAVSAPQANEMIRSCIGRWMAFARQGDHRSLMTDTAENSYSPGYLKKYRKLYPVIGLIGKPKSYDRFRINAQAILGMDALGDLEKIACPTLIIGGEQDRIVGIEASRAMHKRIAGSELVVYPGLGHAAYEEAEDFNARVLRFLEGDAHTGEDSLKVYEKS